MGVDIHILTERWAGETEDDWVIADYYDFEGCRISAWEGRSSVMFDYLLSKKEITGILESKPSKALIDLLKEYPSSYGITSVNLLKFYNTLKVDVERLIIELPSFDSVKGIDTMYLLVCLSSLMEGVTNSFQYFFGPSTDIETAVKGFGSHFRVNYFFER